MFSACFTHKIQCIIPAAPVWIGRISSLQTISHKKTRSQVVPKKQIRPSQPRAILLHTLNFYFSLILSIPQFKYSCAHSLRQLYSQRACLFIPVKSALCTLWIGAYRLHFFSFQMLHRDFLYRRLAVSSPHGQEIFSFRFQSQAHPWVIVGGQTQRPVRQCLFGQMADRLIIRNRLLHISEPLRAEIH